jgi:hypothetical protein
MNTVPLALADVDHAFRQLEFAIRLMCYCELDHLDRSRFDSDISLLFEHENVGFPSGTFAAQEAIVMAAQRNVSICFGVSAMVLDAAFDVVGLRPQPQSHAPADELRTLVYMIRCAFAHNPAFPRWEVRKYYARRFSLYLDASALSVDLASLHGKLFEYQHIGGFGNWLRIRAASEAFINGSETTGRK